MKRVEKHQIVTGAGPIRNVFGVSTTIHWRKAIQNRLDADAVLTALPNPPVVASTLEALEAEVTQKALDIKEYKMWIKTLADHDAKVAKMQEDRKIYVGMVNSYKNKLGVQ